MEYQIGQQIADMHGLNIHHVKCIVEVLSVVKFDIDNASEVMFKMLPSSGRSYADNKALYIIGMGELGGMVVAWHYDGCTLGIANVILAC